MRISLLIVSLVLLIIFITVDWFHLSAAQETRQRASGGEALIEAAVTGNVSTVKRLLEAGADPNARNFAGATALMYAAAGGHTEIVGIFIRAGADVNAKDNDGTDALIAAINKSHHEIAAMLKKAGADPRSEKMVLDIQAMARQFSQRLERTRDFSSLVDEFFAERFLTCHADAAREGEENGIFSQMGTGSLPADASNQIANDEIGRYLMMQLNFFHLKTLYRMSIRKWGAGEGGPENPEEEYPPGVRELLTKNPTATRSSGTVDEMRARMFILQQAILLMRQDFLVNPPEQNAAYKANLERIGNNGYNSKFWEVELFRLPDKDAKGASECLGFPVGQLMVIKVPPFYRLFLVQNKSGFKVAALLCSEPPCAD